MIQRLTLLLNMRLKVYRIAMPMWTIVLPYGSCMSGTLVFGSVPWVFYRVMVCFALVNTLVVAMRVRMRMLWCDTGIKSGRGGVAQWPLWRWICIVLSISLDWIIHKVVLNARHWNLFARVSILRLWRIDLNVTELTCRTFIVAQVVSMCTIMVMAICFSMCWQLVLALWLWMLFVLLWFLSVCSRWKLICTVDTGYGCRTGWGWHRYWILLLRLHLKILNLLHNHVRKAKLDYFLILSYRGYLVIIIVSREEILYGLSTQSSEVLLELLILNVPPLLIDILLVKVVLLGWHERRLQFSFF